MLQFVILMLVVMGLSSTAPADTIRVPRDHVTIQAAIDTATAGDTVLVAAGIYKERIQLRPGISLRSDGDDAKGQIGLKRAESTVIDGGGDNGNSPGMSMAEGSVLDGFTITNIGTFDETMWQKHYDSHGEELADDEGSVQAESVPAVSIRGINCIVRNNVVHHNGDVGIAVSGDEEHRVTPLITKNVSFRNLGGGIGAADHSEAIIRDNTCYENLRAGIGCRHAKPLILNNQCYENVRAGIGCREGAQPIVRGNHCHHNRRAGIGIRMNDTAPIVEHNTCDLNEMAGIGSRDGARPIIRGNTCHNNKRAGIGADGSHPLITGNECRKNLMAGIGLSGQAMATIDNNVCEENRLVAIGVTAGSTANIRNNKLTRTGGMPPLIAVKDGSQARIEKNEIKGGGVAAVLVQGSATIDDNEFQGRGEKQGNAVWVWQGSTATVSNNSFDGYGTAVNASKSRVNIIDNTIKRFRNTAIQVIDSSHPAHIFGNMAITKNELAQIVQIQGPSGVIADNIIKKADSLDASN